ncbi:carbohydrate kinase family protein [Methylococcus capsulatus]|jgi:sulfofructose kinase|uniref:Sulfofructose kinase n=1 Tax=Methylococcus capsulatus TaxID=414 RepID=A0AA35UX51_METCP|nr:PfkB family carbohydrate kinase [Methylococcus capsulatus]CAI8734125.1 sulfofructose kinase [Methylococcus capsulatus]
MGLHRLRQMTTRPLDVLCIGHASFDLVFSVPHHPAADEKIVADALLACGGGPAANAAVTVARLGRKAGFAGYLGMDLYGERHLEELRAAGIDTRAVVRGSSPTPLSVVLVKPDGRRALVNHKGDTRPLPPQAFVPPATPARCILFDGHEPDLSEPALAWARTHDAATVLDAGSLHGGSEWLMFRVGHLVASEKFAAQWLGRNDPERALAALAEHSPCVVITLGEHGLIWRRGAESGRLPAFPVEAVDTTGAGDVFHGAYAAGLAAGMDWPEMLRYASAAGALCCTRLGARPGIPSGAEVERLLAGYGSKPQVMG